jgi:cardiolipin synthase
VPDAPIVKALLLAASRGVEVKILIPRKSDNPLVYLAGLTFLEDLEHPNIEVLLYGKGFMHHKVMLVDDTLASVGTANFDNRSFYLNFEIGAIVAERAFAAEVEEMFLMDMTHCRPLKVDDYLRKNPGYRVLCQAARLLSPVL